MVSHVNRLLIYAHYDEKNIINKYVEFLINNVKNICNEIIFVSTSDISDEEQKKISHNCKKIIKKKNIGYDFSMWKSAINIVDLSNYDEIIILNSSVYGPIFSLDKIFSEMSHVDCDFWGMTESYQIDRHLQSFFLVFRKKVISSKCFKEFWDSVLEYKSKDQIIRSYEVGLSQWLLTNDFIMGCYCSWDRLAMKCRISTNWISNPSVKYPIELLELGMPFVKREVIRDNTLNVNIKVLKNLMSEYGYPDGLLMSEASLKTESIRNGIFRRFILLILSRGASIYCFIRRKYFD